MSTMTAGLDTTAVQALLTELADPDLFADHLDGETAEEHAARRQAASDITTTLLDELAVPLADHPGGLRAGIEAASATITEWMSAAADHYRAETDAVIAALPTTEQVIGRRWAA